MMSNAHGDLVRRWFKEVWTESRHESIDELMHPQCIVHGLGDVRHGAEAFKAFHSAYLDAFPDVSLTVDHVIVEGDTAAARWSGSGTHTGKGLGFAATGKRVTFTGMTFARIQNGKIIEGWNCFDQLGMMLQLGVVAMPA